MKYFLLSAILLVPHLASAHGGRLNREGCHNNRKTGDYHCHRSGGEHSAPRSKFNKSTQSAIAPSAEAGKVVSFNTQSLKYHGLSCTWAKKCTKNCVEIPLSEAISNGGMPCKICGGK